MAEFQFGAEYRFGNAIVIVHEGERTAEERDAEIKAATAKFLKEILIKYPHYFDDVEGDSGGNFNAKPQLL